MKEPQHLAHLGLQIVPKSQSRAAYDLVDEAIAVIKASGIRHWVTPMETVMEGPIALLMEISNAAQEACLTKGADEIIVNIRIHRRKEGDITFEEKTEKHR